MTLLLFLMDVLVLALVFVFGSVVLHSTEQLFLKNLLRLSIWTTGADFLGRAIGNIGAFEQMSYPRSLPSFLIIFADAYKQITICRWARNMQGLLKE